jgi:hypothetical protein
MSLGKTLAVFLVTVVIAITLIGFFWNAHLAN